MKKYDYIIVGAGLFGAVFAREAVNAGKKCLVIEKRNHIGGNVYTEKIEDIHVHKYGAHIIHTSSERAWRYLSNFAQFNNFINSPLANYKGEIYNLPFNMNTFCKMWGVITPIEAKKIIDSQCIRLTGEAENLEEKVLSLVGSDIYEKLIKGYTEKQWGKSCKELPPDTMRRIPLRFTYDNNYYNVLFQGVPIGGYTAIFEKLLDGSEVMFNVDYLEHRDEFHNAASKIIFTGTIDSYFNYSLGELEYRGLKFETEIFDVENYQGNAVINYTDSIPSYTRIIEHKHFEYGTQEKTVVTKEYPIAWNRTMEPYYPINDKKNMLLYEQYRQLALKEPEVIFGGRLGSYAYYDMGDTIDAALELAAKELAKI